MTSFQSASLNSSPYPQSGIHFKFFPILLILFCSTWLVADIAAVKMVRIFGIIFTGGFLIFPLTSMLNLIIVEIYGYKNARQTIWSGFILNTTYIIFIHIVNIIPSSPYWHLNHEFQSILVPQTRIIVASVLSFLLADFSNSYLMAKMKIKSKGRSLAKRILIASTLSLSIDILCFITLAFYNTMPNLSFMQLMLTVYIKKILSQLLLFPLACYLISLIKDLEGTEVYDYDTQFNPFSFDNFYELTPPKPKKI